LLAAAYHQIAQAQNVEPNNATLPASQFLTVRDTHILFQTTSPAAES